MKLVRNISFAIFGLIAVILAIATIIEKSKGSDFAFSKIYGSWWFIALWGILAAVSLAYIIKVKLHKRPVTFLLHLSFLLILAGALTTHLFGIQGTCHVRMEESTNLYLDRESNLIEKFPFQIELKRFQVENYPGTASPMDYVSVISIDNQEISISMNHIGECQNWRFYQSGYDEDGAGTILSVSHDPWGIGITYTGYALLFISMLAFLILPNEGFRKLLSKKVITTAFLLGVAYSPSYAQEGPKTLPKDLAAEMGDLYCYYNGRICPFQTVAKDFITKLYGKSSYKEFSAEQVFTGWLLYPTTWTSEPMIKIKGRAKEALGCNDSYTSYDSFHDNYGNYKLETLLRDIHFGRDTKNSRDILEADEKLNIILMLFNGQLTKIYPYNNGDELIWLSQADEQLPKGMPEDQWFFIKRSMDYLAEMAVMKHFDKMKETIGKIKDYQIKNAGKYLPSDNAFKAEKLYNNMDYTKPLAMAFATLGILIFFVYIRFWLKGKPVSKKIKIPLQVTLTATTLYLAFVITLRGYVAGHLPLSNGYETMQFMGLCSLVITLCLQNKFILMMPFGFLLAGLTLLVSMMGESNPQITPLMPVLASPLLSIHVCVIMLAYSLLAFCLFNGITALCLQKMMHHNQVEQLHRISHLMLYPALFLLAAGIFIGAIWANVSWGRYWGWDPKEVWALITFMVYALALHNKSIKWFGKPLHFHLYMVMAFLCVLITYFGVNFLLGGMHSYAG